MQYPVMTHETDALQTILTVVDQVIGYIDEPFVLVAKSPGDEIIVRSNLDPAELKQIAEGLGEAAADAAAAEIGERPANDDGAAPRPLPSFPISG